ncbi:hypothetical protein [Parerythrobacter jejuensis]|uniref:Imelysin-like domain-containing protein n=1 Tax=Parerythrobacter jejuensis TaxID=795812 RepID=A0A845ASD0_9SPHN|nr:hypothetical protein [Parerythrobacter jejuensis]MXP31751.1 hypothetical protein [Parerythrobacter jejuensis]
MKQFSQAMLAICAMVAGATVLPYASIAAQNPVYSPYDKWHAELGAELRAEVAILLPLIQPACPASEAIESVLSRYAEVTNSLALPRQKIDLEIANADYSYALMQTADNQDERVLPAISFVGEGCPKPDSPQALEAESRTIALANSILDRMERLVVQAPESSGPNPRAIPGREWRGDDDFYKVWVTYGRAERAYTSFRNRHCAFGERKQRSLSHVLKETRERLDMAKQRIDVLWPGGTDGAVDLFSDEAADVTKRCDDAIAANEAFGAALGARDALEFLLNFKERERLLAEEP